MEHFNLFSNMRIFLLVSDLGSFSACAKRIKISQPSVSRKISALEEHLGVRLFHRSTRKLSLTEAGKMFYDRARSIQKDVADAQASLAGFKERPTGTLRISTPVLWAETKILPRLPEFLTRFPEIKLEIESNDNIQDLVEDELDLVIRIGEFKDTSHIVVPFGSVRFRICATPKYLEEKGTPKNINDLTSHFFSVYENRSEFLISANETTTSIKVKNVMSSNSASILLKMTLEGGGLSVLPYWIIKEHLDKKELVEILPEYDLHVKNLSASHVFALYSSRTHLPAKVRAFLDFYRPDPNRKSSHRK